MFPGKYRPLRNEGEFMFNLLAWFKPRKKVPYSRKLERVILFLEVLEDRTLFQAGGWTSIGPSPQGQNAPGFSNPFLAAANGNRSGRVSDLTYLAHYRGAGHPARLGGSPSLRW